MTSNYLVRFRLLDDATDLSDRETVVSSTFTPTANRIRHWCPQLRDADILEIEEIHEPEAFIVVRRGEVVTL